MQSKGGKSGKSILCCVMRRLTGRGATEIMERKAVSDTVTVRPGEKRDCAEVAKLIQDFAVNEKAEGHAKLSAEVLEKDGFGEEQYFRLVVAEDQSMPEGRRLVGYIFYCPLYSSFEGRCIFVEDFYVSPSARSSGVGSRLFTKVTQLALESGCCRVCWNVRSHNTIAIKYYNGIGALDLSESEGWHSYRLEQEAMEALVKGKK